MAVETKIKKLKKKIRALQKLIKKGSSEYKSGLWLVKGYNTGNNQNPKKLQRIASVRAKCIFKS